MNYCRLKMVDVNGSYTYSKTISIAASSGQVFVFPNPVKDKLFIAIPNVSTETTIHIGDVKGIIVKTLQMKAGVTAASFNTTELQAGVYSIIFDSGKVKETLQFIKQ